MVLILSLAGVSGALPILVRIPLLIVLEIENKVLCENSLPKSVYVVEDLIEVETWFLLSLQVHLHHFFCNSCLFAVP